MPEEADHSALDVSAGEAQMSVGEDVARRFQHARILPAPRSLYKQTMPDDLRDVTNEAAAPRVVTPPAGALPPHDIQFRVRYAETDQMGVVYHTNYLIWCEVGRTDFIRARGMSYADIERSGVGLAVSDLKARFHGAARYDDLVRVRTTLADLRSRSITFDYVITNAETNERLVSASTTLVSIDKSGRLVAIPSTVRGLFQPLPLPQAHPHTHTQTPPENR
jgi:acyl-CoA thioester hydrolase